MTSKVVLLCGYYGYGNGGDEALLATLLQMLPDAVQPIVMSAAPNVTAAQHGVEACHRNRPREVFKVMRRADAFIWGGGSLIQDATSLASPLYYIGWMSVAQALGLKTIAWAQGIGPLNRSAIRTIARRSFGQCTARSTRDVASSALLDAWNLPHTLAPDPVWALGGNSATSLNPTDHKRVAVVLRRHPSLTEARLSVVASALQQFQTQTRIQLLLLPFQRSQDYEIAVALQQQLPECSEVLMLEDPRQLKGIFQSVEMTIAMRLHALIMAAAEGCRCFALSYDPKVSQLMADLNLPGWHLEAMPTDPATLVEAWKGHLNTDNPMKGDIVRDRMDRSRLHQTVLAQVLN